jgi:RNA polymerase sigma factor (sigma-70 family)
MEEEDVVLIKSILNGNRESENILYEKYRKIVSEFILFKYPQNLDIDDDVSEIMIKIVIGLGSFDDSKGKFKSWVLTIVKNYMIDKWRNATIKPISFSNSYIDDSQIESWYDSDASLSIPNYNEQWNNSSLVSSNTANYDNCSTIAFLSTQLSPYDYTLLNMKYVHGYNYCEIGNEFNLTSNTVSNKVNYIKSKLKGVFSEMMEE